MFLDNDISTTKNNQKDHLGLRISAVIIPDLYGLKSKILTISSMISDFDFVPTSNNSIL